MKVHVIGFDKYYGGSCTQERYIYKLWNDSDKRHELVDNVEAADIILLADVRSEHCFKVLRQATWLGPNIGKTFLISDLDKPYSLLHGVCSSTSKKMARSGRYFSGSYCLYPPKYRNPFVEALVDSPFSFERKYLLSFLGRRSNNIRSKIFALNFARTDIIVRDTSDFDLFREDERLDKEKQIEYTRTLAASKFALCPRGSGYSSIRLFEALALGVVPVILADEWQPCPGISWENISIMVPERDCARIEEIVVANESRAERLGQAAYACFRENFSDDSYFNYVVGNCAHIRQGQLRSEKLHWMLRNYKVAFWQMLKIAYLKFS